MILTKPHVFYKTRRHSATYTCITTWQHRVTYIGDGKVFCEYYQSGKKARLHFLFFVRKMVRHDCIDEA